MAKRVLVTGGAGFIGSHIVDAFVARGDEVHIIDDLSSGERRNLSGQATFIEADICSEEAAKAVRDIKPEVLVHAAAQISVSVSMKEPVLDARVNVVGLTNLLHALGTDLTPHVVFLSTGGAIYGEQDTFPASESHPCRPTSVYGLNKYVSEQYLEFWNRERSLPYTVLRLANVYGPRQNPHGEAGVIAIFHKMLLQGKTPTIFGSGEQTRDFVYVGDVVAAVVAAADRGEAGTFNVGTGKETSVNELYAAICNSVGVDVKAHYEPRRDGEQLRSCIDATAAERDLHWSSSYPLEAGLGETSEWFRSEYSS